MALIFDRFARWTEHQLGHPAVFVTACLSIVLWGITGPFFGWSDTWQLVVNTGTTIVTFSDGLRDPEHAKSGYPGAPAEARRVDSGECGGAEFADGTRRAAPVRDHRTQIKTCRRSLVRVIPNESKLSVAWCAGSNRW